ncbi:MAG: DUF305 domain-containing protein [Chloroflexia bacterium]|nr:DUF305 domain-containing protein [Chloroflexia bacterium]
MKRLFVLTAIIGLLLAACGSANDNEQPGGGNPNSADPAATSSEQSDMPGMAATMTPGADPSGMGGESTATDGMSFDQMFIAGMVPHHQSAIDMADMARTRAEHKEIGQLASDIISAQQREIGQMRTWYKQWYGTDQIPQMDEQMMGEMMPGTDMEGMEATDLSKAEPFDKAFIDAMIPHHQSAVMMAQHALKQAKRPEIKQLAQEIIASQEQEITQMKQWQTAWYGS